MMGAKENSVDATVSQPWRQPLANLWKVILTPPQPL